MNNVKNYTGIFYLIIPVFPESRHDNLLNTPHYYGMINLV